jgi:DNA-binding response OmpR family regulator
VTAGWQWSAPSGSSAPEVERGPAWTGEQAKSVPRQYPHILLIEDAADVRELMTELLESEGFAVSGRPFANADVDEIGYLMPSAIVVGYQGEKDASGCALLHALRRNAGTCAIPVVLCAGFACDLQALGPRWTDFDAPVVLKPFDIDRFVAVVRTALWPPAADAEMLPAVD